jgi:pilus assembly protein CpaE
VTLFSPKGGVGTSVLAANLAALLARNAPGPVALLDAHIEFGDAAVLFNVAPRHTIVDAVSAAHEGDIDVVQRLLMRHEPSGVYVLPAPIDPAQVDNISAHDVLAVVAALKEVCSYVIIDTPSTFNDVVLGAFEISDEVVFVGSDDVPAVKNVKVALQAMSLLNLTAPRVSLILNRIQGNGRIHIGEVERALGVKVDLAIPEDAVVPDSVKRGSPFVLDAPKSKAARAVEALSARISTPRPRTDADLMRST